MGIRTPWVDALTFGLGSGIAGIAGVALSQIDNVSPNLGQGYIIDSFMVVVFGGVGNLWGTLVGALSLGIAQQVPRALCRRGARQDPRAGADHPLHPEAPARPVRAQGPGGGSMITQLLLPRARPDGASADRRCILLAVAVARAGPAICCCPAGSPLHVPTYVVALIGKYLCYALLALALDLVWGYCGILSLGHGAFFALGGYAMGMYLMRQIGSRGVYGNPMLPDFMVFLNWKELPWFWYGFDQFWFAALMVVLVPGLLAFVFGWFAFRSPRHRRLSLDHHPGDDLCAAARLLPQRHGLRRQQRPDRFQGHPRLQRAGRRDARGAVRGLARSRWRSASSSRSAIVSSKLRQGAGRACATPKAARASSATASRTSSSSPSPSRPCMAGIAGALYVPQVGIINPGEFEPANSIEVVIWTAVGGRGTHRRADHRRDAGQRRQELVHRRAARILAVRARRPVRRRHAVPAQGHRRHVGPVARRPPRKRSAASRRRRAGRSADAAAARPKAGAAIARTAAGGVSIDDADSRHPPLSRRRLGLLRRLPRASTTCRSSLDRARCAPSSARTAPARRR